MKYCPVLAAEQLAASDSPAAMRILDHARDEWGGNVDAAISDAADGYCGREAQELVASPTFGRREETPAEIAAEGARKKAMADEQAIAAARAAEEKAAAEHAAAEREAAEQMLRKCVSLSGYAGSPLVSEEWDRKFSIRATGEVVLRVEESTIAYQTDSGKDRSSSTRNILVINEEAIKNL